MARDEYGYATYIGSGRVEVSGPTSARTIDNRLKNFRKYFQAALGETTRRLSTAGVNAARKRLREAETPWGQARMRGEYFGVSFRSYGRSAGREDTGNMLDSLSTWVDEASMALGVSRNRYQGYFGWAPEDVDGYFLFQEYGFYSSGSFDAVATAASGVAKFKKGVEKFIPGANSLLAGERTVAKIARSFYSGAWNEAVKQWRRDGFTSDPGSFIDNYPRGPVSNTDMVRFNSPTRDEF